jgi:hypothetical protein
VHGLFGHPKNTWSINSDQYASDERESGRSVIRDINNSLGGRPSKRQRLKEINHLDEVFWPRDLLPQALPQARVFTWGYDVQIERMFSSTSKAPIFHHAETLLSDLVSTRSITSNGRVPIIFIAHSLGGIVVKDALSISANAKTFVNEIFLATIGVMFLGTPHKGSRVASLGKIAFELSKMLLMNPNLQVLRALETNSEILERISSGFWQVLSTDRIEIHSFREELETNGVMIVDSSSATIGYHRETRSSLHENHRNMAKISSINDAKFPRVTGILKRWIEGASNGQSNSLAVPRQETRAQHLWNVPIIDDEYADCLRLLGVDEARLRFNEVGEVYEKTYQWIFDEQVGLAPWLRGEVKNPTYWIHGKPGSGKSTAMKFVITHPRTKELLHKYSESPWIIASYFFRVCGPKEPETTEIFIQEILYQMLQQRQELFPIVREVFIEDKSTNSHSRRSFEGLDIRPCEIRNVLLSIAKNSSVEVNLCLFIDALDEHDGDHRELVSILVQLSQVENSQFFRLRLCVAGRPENVFKDAFDACPGFRIQDHTKSDIQIYAEGKLRGEVKVALTAESEKIFDSFIASIVDKAEGVFLWLKLVVDELMQGLCEGDSIAELQESIYSTPTELAKLYDRAVQKSYASSFRHMASSSRAETYFMFRVAAESPLPLEPRIFVSAAQFMASGEQSLGQSQDLSDDQIERRIYSRTAGLLEVDNLKYVQFIHETVKEFIISSEGDSLIKSGIYNPPFEAFEMLLLRYVTSYFVCLEESEQYFDFDIDICTADKLLVILSKKVENDNIGSLASCFEIAFGSLSEDQLYHVLLGFDRVAMELTPDRDKLYHHWPPDRETLFFSFYVRHGLTESLKSFMASQNANTCTKSAIWVLHCIINDVPPFALPSAPEGGSPIHTLLKFNLLDDISREQFLALEKMMASKHSNRWITGSRELNRRWPIFSERWSAKHGSSTSKEMEINLYGMYSDSKSDSDSDSDSRSGSPVSLRGQVQGLVEHL